MSSAPRCLGGAWAGRSGFSLVEVVLAIGIISFAMVILVALLPTGLQLARKSTEETSALNLASAISSDLQSTPLASAQSVNFKIAPLPWTSNASLAVVPNSAIALNTDYVFYANEGQGVVSAADARYRVTLRYTQVPGKSAGVPLGSPASIEALLKVSWPPAATNGQGQIESYLVFAKP